jgi:hypothetical protein
MANRMSLFRFLYIHTLYLKKKINRKLRVHDLINYLYVCLTWIPAKECVWIRGVSDLYHVLFYNEIPCKSNLSNSHSNLFFTFRRGRKNHMSFVIPTVSPIFIVGLTRTNIKNNTCNGLILCWSKVQTKIQL